MKHFYLCVLFIFLLFNVGCLGESKHIIDLTSTDPDNLVERGLKLYSVNCASCHGTLPYPSSPAPFGNKLNTSPSEISNAISKNMGGMFKLHVLTKSEIAAISAAINDKDEDLPIEAGKVSNVNPVTGTKYFVSNNLIYIFADDSVGDVSPIITDVLLNIFIKGSAFSGYCSRFETMFCFTSGSMSPAVSTMRAGYVNSICNIVLSKDIAIDSALKRINRTVDSQRDTDSIYALFELFHPGQTPPGYVISNMQTLASKVDAQGSFSNYDKWRFLILPMCNSIASEAL